MIGNEIKVEGEKFIIKKFLGKGKSGYSYLMTNGQKNYVFKKMHDEPCPYYDFEGNKVQMEVNDYQILKNLIAVPQLIDYNLEEKYLVKEYIAGLTAAEVIAEDSLTDELLKQMFDMFKIVKEEGLNIDYFPTNFVVTEENLFYIDYEFNEYDPQWDLINWGIYYWANSEGMKEYLETSTITKLNQDQDSGIPDKEPVADTVQNWLNKYY